MTFEEIFNKSEEVIKYKDEFSQTKVDGYTFIPDLMFMNQFAVCRYCGQIYMWEYEKGYMNKGN